MERHHILKKGESLEDLSALYGVPVCMIMRANMRTFAEGIRSGLSVAVPQKDMCEPMRMHRVKKGDTVYSLSKRYSVTMRSILELNKIQHPSALREDMCIKIPPCVGIYTVGATDTMSSISEKLGIPAEELIRLNKTARVYRGMQLKLPY